MAVRVELEDRVVDLETGHVSGGGRLTQLECALVKHLRRLGGRCASRDALLVEVWGFPKPVPTRAVDTAVRRVRRKIEANPSDPRHLLTVQGEGYRWVEGASGEALDVRAHWEARRVEVSALLGRELAVTAPEVGLREVIAEHLGALPAEAIETLERLAVLPEGLEAAELGALAARLPALLAGEWIEAHGQRFRVAAPWCGVVESTPSAREAGVAVLTARAESGGAVSVSEVDAALAWDGDPASLARLVLAVELGVWRAGRFDVLARWADTLLARSVPDGLAAELHLLRGNLLRGQGCLEEAAADAARALALAPDPVIAGQAHGLMGLLAHTRSEWRVAAEAYGEAVERLWDAKPVQAAQYLAERAIVSWTLDEPDALDEARRAHELVQRVLVRHPDDGAARATLARTSRAVGTILVGLGRAWEAVPRLTELVTQLEHDRPGTAVTLCIPLAMAMLDVGDVDEAERWLREGERLAARAGEALLGGMVHNGWAYVHALRGDRDRAHAALLRTIRVFEDAGMPQRTIVPRCWVAVQRFREGAVEEARQVYELALSHRLERESPGVDGVLGSTAEVLGCAGPAVTGAGLRQAYVRVARRAWGLEVPSP